MRLHTGDWKKKGKRGREGKGGGRDNPQRPNCITDGQVVDAVRAPRVRGDARALRPRRAPQGDEGHAPLVPPAAGVGRARDAAALDALKQRKPR